MTKLFSERVKPLKLDYLVVTDLVKDTMMALLSDLTAVISYSPSRQWGGTVNKHPMVGAWVVKGNYFGNEDKIFKTHGRAIIALFNNGFIEVDTNHEVIPKFTFFKISDAAKAEIRKVRQVILFQGSPRVRKERLNELAELYGVKLLYQPSRGLFKIVRSDGNSFRHDEYITFNADGMPVTKYGDLSWEEWEDIFYESQQIILNIK